MQKFTAILVCLLPLMTACIGDENRDADDAIPGAGVEDYTAPVDGADVKMWLEWNVPFADANKTGIDDSQLCWAAAVANIVTWTGWAVDENSTFDAFKGHFENNPGYVYDALRFYFKEFVPEVSADMVTVRECRAPLLVDFIASALYAGKGVIIKIEYPNHAVGHFLTVYGYRTSDQPDNPVLFFTDPDDHQRQMRQMSLLWNGAAKRWEIKGLYADWYLEYAVSLARP